MLKFSLHLAALGRTACSTDCTLTSGERPAKPHVPGRTVPLLPPSSAWHYIDPEGKEQGPFDAKKLINWVDLGYFGQSDLQVSSSCSAFAQNVAEVSFVL